MNAGNWIELVALLVTILGGGGVGVSRLTRVAVAIEQLGAAMQTLGPIVQGHTTQLAVHENRLTMLDGQQPPGGPAPAAAHTAPG